MQSCSFQFCMCPCHAAGKVSVPAPYDSAASVMGGEESRNTKVFPLPFHSLIKLAI